MPTLCVQCLLEAVVARQPYDSAISDEEPLAHMARRHPNPIATEQRRRELERLIQQDADLQAQARKALHGDEG